MPDEDLTIKLSATGANQAAGEVRKVADATEGFGGQAEGTDAFLRTLDETLEDTERTVMEVAEAMEELEEVQERLNDVTEEGVEVNEEANRERRRLAEEDVETVKRARADEEESLRRRARVTTAAVAGGAALLAQSSRSLIQYSEDLRVVNGESADSVESLGVAANDYADIATQIAVGAGVGGPFGAIAGALTGAFALVVEKTAEARAGLEAAERDLQSNLQALQALISAERDRDLQVQNGAVERAYQARIGFIREELRLLGEAVDLDRIRSGGDADREVIGIDRQIRALNRDESLPEGERELQVQQLQIDRTIVQEKRQQSQLERELTETAARRVAADQELEAAEQRTQALRDARNNLSFDADFANFLESADVPQADRNRLTAQGNEDLQTQIQLAEGLIAAAREAEVAAESSLAVVDSAIENVEARLQEFGLTSRERITDAIERSQIAVEEATVSEATNFGQNTRDLLRPILDIETQNLTAQAQQARAQIEQVLSDGEVELEEIGRFTTAVNQLIAERDSQFSTVLNQVSLAARITGQNFTLLSATQTQLNDLERRLIGRLQQVEARGGQN